MYIMHLYKSIDEIPERDEQILGSICPPLTGSESWFDKFFFVNKFSRGLLGEKNFLMKIWLPWKICHDSNTSLCSYLTHYESDSDETCMVGWLNKLSLSKRNIVVWKTLLPQN